MTAAAGGGTGVFKLPFFRRRRDNDDDRAIIVSENDDFDGEGFKSPQPSDSSSSEDDEDEEVGCICPRLNYQEIETAASIRPPQLSDFSEEEDDKEYNNGQWRLKDLEPLVDEEKPQLLDSCSKAAALRASPSIVSVATRNPHLNTLYFGDGCEAVYMGTGVILECVHHGDAGYLSTIIAPATIFPIDQFEIDVEFSDGKRFKGHLFASDPHYNLAIVTINSDSPLPTALLRGLDDVSSIDLDEHLQFVAPTELLQLRPHSNLYKILPGTKLLTLTRLVTPPCHLQVHSGVFGTYDLYVQDRVCKELYWVKEGTYKGGCGGAIVNCFGEVIGIMFYKYQFLPSNLISRWWNYYKSYKKFCRPWLGLEIANLDTAGVGFLEEFRSKFPDIGRAVVVAKVEKDTPAYCSGIRPKDVIVKCDGMLARSKMEFFEIIWDNAGKSVELTILRAYNGKQLKLSITIGETTPDKFYWWEFPAYCIRSKHS